MAPTHFMFSFNDMRLNEKGTILTHQDTYLFIIGTRLVFELDIGSFKWIHASDYFAHAVYDDMPNIWELPCHLRWDSSKCQKIWIDGVDVHTYLLAAGNRCVEPPGMSHYHTWCPIESPARRVTSLPKIRSNGGSDNVNCNRLWYHLFRSLLKWGC